MPGKRVQGLTRVGATMTAALVALILSAPAALAAPDYGPARPVSESGDDATRPQVAIDSDGRATVAWYGFDEDGVARIRIARIRHDNAVGPVRTISTSRADAAYPTLDVDRDGRVTVAWYSSTQTGIVRVEAVRIKADGTVGKVRTLSARGEIAFFPQVIVSPRGLATIVWQTEAPTNRIQARRMREDGTLGPVLTLDSHPRFTVKDPRLGIDGRGRVTVAWTRFDGERDQFGSRNATVRTTRLSPNGRPEPARRISPRTQNASYPQVAVDRDGRALVVWNADHIYSRSIEEDLTLGARRKISLGDGVDPPSIAMDPLGRTWAAWFRNNGSAVDVVRLSERGTVDQRHRFPPAGFATPEGPAVAVNGQGAATVLWAAFEGGTERMYAAEISAEGVASPVTPVSADGDIEEAQDAEAGPDGRFLLAWARTTNAGTRVEFTRSQNGTAAAQR